MYCYVYYSFVEMGYLLFVGLLVRLVIVWLFVVVIVGLSRLFDLGFVLCWIFWHIGELEVRSIGW